MENHPQIIKFNLNIILTCNIMHNDVFLSLFIYLMRCFSILVSSLDISQRMGYQIFHNIGMTKFASKM